MAYNIDEQQQAYSNKVKYGISDATIRNWEKLNTHSDGRLTTRANKRKSQKRILPIEYVSNNNNIEFIHQILDYIDTEKLNITSVIFSLGISLLKKAGIYGKPHVTEVLSAYSEIVIISNFINISLPDNEFDILGLVYQSFLREGKKNATGAYYTPQKIACNMTKDFDFSDGQLFLDPCCGSGAFLISIAACNPRQIYGVDIDRIAVFIAKINLLIKYSDYEFIPQVYCLDFLMGNSIIQQHSIFEKKFDYIATNPPWGAMVDNYPCVNKITSRETFSYFFVKSYEQLKETGTIRFLFPESILNVKVHKDIRKFILDTAKLISITVYNDMFSSVTTKYVDIKCGNGTDKKHFTVNINDERQLIAISSIYETENLIFNSLSNNDISIVEIVKEKGKYSLRDSVWALGIVTGDNKRKLFSECSVGMEKIYTGKEVQPFVLLPAKKYIRYDREALQQVAREEIYRAPEKLVYKFISNKLVFAYDDNASLFLNSANILIPSIPSMNIKTVLAFLNSTLFQFVYIKLFGEVKVLRGNLAELPFPQISTIDNTKLTNLADKVLGGDTSSRKKIDDYIFAFYGLNSSQIAYVRSIVNGKID